jgi:hypothetical protein
MLEITPNFPLTLTNVLWGLGIAAATIAATATVTWQIRKDRIEALTDELETLRESKDWKLPDTLKQLNALSETLRADLGDRSELDELRKKAVALLGLEERVAQLQKELEIARTVSTEVEVREGEAVELMKPALVLGVASFLLNRATINITNQQSQLEMGNYIEVDYQGKQYRLTLLGIDRSKSPTTARFSFYPTGK